MKIAVINTGGTISCIGEPLAPMSAADFASASEKMLNPILTQQFPDIEITYLTNIAFPESSSATLDSTNLQPTDWCVMAAGILANYADYDGFLVLHGTDSMDFTGAALPFLLNNFDEIGIGTAVLSKPVIITGSQIPLYYKKDDSAALTFNFNTDAYQNVCGAVASARTGVPEVCVYFQNQLYRGNRVLKTNASEFNAFSSPNYPALAEYGVELSLFNENWLPGPVHDSVSLDNASVLAAQQTALKSIANNIDNYPIAQVNAFPARYSQNKNTAYMADIISSIVGTGAAGLILESYGEGNFPSGNPDSPSDGAIYQALNKANTDGVNIVDCTQVISGSVNNSAYASGAWLPQVGALSPADMTPMSALAKLMILSSLRDIHGWSRDQLRTLFQTNLAGEMSSVNNIDSRSNAVLMPGQAICTLDSSAKLTNDQADGPVLCASGSETPLWSLPIAPAATDLPGRLVMQNDGNLVFYSRYNKALWASNSGNPAGASSKLTLSGHYNANNPTQSNLSLQVYNYSDNTIAAKLYPTVTENIVFKQPQRKELTMSATTRQFKFSGVIGPLDQFHQETSAPVLGATPDEHYVAPTTVQVNITVPEKKTIGVPQYSPTVYGNTTGSYNPAGDCNGNFMSSKFQPNNNCYAYGCNITPNTFPQPGRQSGYLLTADDFNKSFADLGQLVSSYAVKDGLEFVGRTLEELMAFKSSKQGTNPEGVAAGYLAGHFVALMISTAGDADWPGDYHWARCDNSSGGCDSWSQKDGSDQVTNFDFAGKTISNPATANWSVNQGPVSKSDTREMLVEYDFYCFMFVPDNRVNII